MRRVLNRVLLELPLRADSGPSDWGFDPGAPGDPVPLARVAKGRRTMLRRAIVGGA